MQSRLEVKLHNVVNDDKNETQPDGYDALPSSPINFPTPVYQLRSGSFTSQNSHKSKNITISSPIKSAANSVSPLPADDDLHDEPLEKKEDKTPDSKASSEISIAYAAKFLFLSTIVGAVTGYAAVMCTLTSMRSHDYNGFMCDFYNKNATEYGCNFTWPSSQMDCSGTSSLSCSFQNQSNAANQAASDYAEPLAQNAVTPLLMPSLVAGILGGGIVGFFAGAAALKRRMQFANSTEERAAPSSLRSP